MKKKPDISTKAELRRQAEVKLSKSKQKKAALPATEAETARLIHELEMQNEVLMQSRAELEAAYRQFSNLYDFAPVGYFTLARDGTIHDANLAGANLLDLERGKLIGRRFGVFVSVESRPVFSAFLEKLLSGEEKESCELALLKIGNEPLWVRLEATCFKDGQESRAVMMDITARKRAEEALRHSEEHLRNLAQRLPDAVYTLELPTQKVTYFNHDTFLGYSRSELMADHSILSALHPEDSPAVLTKWKRIMNGETLAPIEYRVRNRAGDWEWVQNRWVVQVRNAEGSPTQIMIILSTITERKQAEELLRESEERYRDLVEVSPNAILVQSEGRLVFVNPAAIKLLRAAHSGQLIGKSMWEIIHPDYHQIARENIQKLAEGQGVPPQEGKFIRLDGSSVDVEVIPTRLIYQNLPAVQIIAQDITERKQVEESLRASEERFYKVFEGSPAAMIVSNPAGEITLANAQACNLLGYTIEELTGMNIEQLAPENLRDQHAHHRATYNQRPSARPMTGRNLIARHKDSTEFPVEIGLTPLMMGESTFTLASIMDLTERKQAEEALRYLSTHDALTGLYSRGFMMEEMARLERGREFPVSIVMADVDHLKQTNDQQGHAAGDALLKHVAQALTAAFRAEDVVARIGGDEFAVLLPNTDAAAAGVSLQRVRQVIQENNAAHTVPPIRLSLGVSTAENPAPLSNVLKEADANMYREKRGRDTS